MANTIKNITLPATMKLTAGAEGAKFAPYKENFITSIKANSALVLKVDTVGQYFYYKNQGFVEGAAADGDLVINVPAIVTIANNSGKAMNFIPYRENFQQEIKANEGYSFDATTAGQVLYYLSQDTNTVEVDGGLDVTQVAKA